MRAESSLPILSATMGARGGHFRVAVKRYIRQITDALIKKCCQRRFLRTQRFHALSQDPLHTGTQARQTGH